MLGRLRYLVPCRWTLGFALMIASLPARGIGADMDIVLWNLGINCTGTDGVNKRDRCYDALRAQAPDADVILCNECYSATVTDFKNRLIRDTGTTWYAIPQWDFGSHNHHGLLSRYSFASTPVKFEFSQPANYDVGPKTAGAVNLNVEGTTVTVVLTRLCSPCGATVRGAQGAELRDWAAGLSPRHIVLGDFNDRRGTTNINTMGESYIDAYWTARSAGTATTYPDNPNGNTYGCGTLDYIWLPRNQGLSVVRSAVPDVRAPPLLNPNPAVTQRIGCTDDYGVRPSDHNMLTGTIRIPTAPIGPSACDINRNGSIDVADVQLCVNQAIAVTPCLAAGQAGSGDVNRDSSCNVLDVQRVVNTVLGQPCL